MKIIKKTIKIIALLSYQIELLSKILLREENLDRNLRASLTALYRASRQYNNLIKINSQSKEKSFEIVDRIEK